jgi:hypothetical protein
VSRGAQRRRRSKAVGSTSPTSTPRCASRHCTASGKRLHRERCGPQRRWRPANRDLRGTCSRRDRRQAGVTRGATPGACPPFERRPPGQRLGGDRPGADPPADRRNWLPNDRPQRERHRDRRVAVVSPGGDPARNDRQDRAAAHASVAPAADHDPAGNAVGFRRSADLAIADPVSVESQLAADGPTGSTAVSTCPGSGTLD